MLPLVVNFTIKEFIFRAALFPKKLADEYEFV